MLWGITIYLFGLVHCLLGQHARVDALLRPASLLAPLALLMELPSFALVCEQAVEPHLRALPIQWRHSASLDAGDKLVL